MVQELEQIMQELLQRRVDVGRETPQCSTGERVWDKSMKEREDDKAKTNTKKRKNFLVLGATRIGFGGVLSQAKM